MAKRRGNGDGSIFERDGKWKGSILLGKKRHYVTAKTRREVRDKLDELKQDYREGYQSDQMKLTVEGMLDRWLDTLHTQEANTIAGYRRYAKNHIIPRIGSIIVSDLTEEHIEGMLASMKKAELSGRSRQAAFRVLSMALKRAARRKVVRFNVCENVTSPTPDKKTQATLSEKHLKIYFSALNEERLRALFVLMAQTGLRVSEALGLCWDSVDLESGKITIQRRLTDDGDGGYELKECGKTKISMRTIKLSALAETELHAHLSRMEKEGNDMSRYVFCREDGEHLRRRYVWNLHKSILKQAGIPYVTLKNLRHTVATTLLGRRHSLKVVADLLGHSTIKVTADSYSHVSEGIHAEAVADVGSAMTPATDENCCETVVSGRIDDENQPQRVDAKHSVSND